MTMPKFMISACFLLLLLANFGERCEGNANTSDDANPSGNPGGNSTVNPNPGGGPKPGENHPNPGGNPDDGGNTTVIPNPGGNPNPGGVFDVTKFGAKPDGNTDSCGAFLAAWQAACSWNGEVAKLVIPEGKYTIGPVQFLGPCRNVKKMIVEVKGTVMASTDLKKFPEDEWIVFRRINGLTLTGGGVFNGQGACAWPKNKCHKSSRCNLLPTSLKFIMVTNSTVRSISSVDSKLFHIFLFNCRNMDFQHINISAPETSPNTDGINMRLSDNITISSSEISTGDDCIAIGHGSTNIFVSDVKCGPGHGISVGSLGKYTYETDVKTVRIKNCSFSGTENGIRIKTWPNSKSSISASDFVAENITMNGVRHPIIIDQTYCPHRKCASQTPSSVKISNVHFKNIKGTSSDPIAVYLECSKNYPCKDVTLHNIDLKCIGDGTNTTSSCLHVEGSSTGFQNPASCFQSPPITSSQ